MYVYVRRAVLVTIGLKVITLKALSSSTPYSMLFARKPSHVIAFKDSRLRTLLVEVPALVCMYVCMHVLCVCVYVCMCMYACVHMYCFGYM